MSQKDPSGQPSQAKQDELLDDRAFYQWISTYSEPHPTPKTLAKAAWFAALKWARTRV